MTTRKTSEPVGGDATRGDDPGFEPSLERLEVIVEELEAGSLTLEQSIARYEEGMRLSRRLTATLDEAEKKIEQLIASDGEVATRPLDLDAEERKHRDGGAPARREPPVSRRPPGDVEELPF